MIRTLRRLIPIVVIIGGLSFLLSPPAFRELSRRDFYGHGVNPNTLPSRLTDDDMPVFEPGTMDRIVGLAGKDLADKDLHELTLPALCEWTFDVNTKWPQEERLPVNFDSRAWMQTGMDPGLGIRALHLRGITGRGVAVAVIDKPMLSSHNEFMGRIKYRKVSAWEGLLLHFHGISCASILAGGTCGVAPEATLHYFSVPDNARTSSESFSNYSRALDEMIRVNAALPVNQRIRLVSISHGYGNLKPNHPWISAEKRAREAGIAVVYANPLMAAGFGWGGCPPMAERNVADNYRWADYWLDEKRSTAGRILIPASYRTTASNTGNEDYIYWGEAGFSWAIPYVAGVMTLAWNVDAKLTGDQIIDVIKATATKRSTGDLVINPLSVIEDLDSRRLARPGNEAVEQETARILDARWKEVLTPTYPQANCPEHL